MGARPSLLNNTRRAATGLAQRGAALGVVAFALTASLLLAGSAWADAAPAPTTGEAVPAHAAAPAGDAADPGDAAAGSFVMRCSGCHSVGGGPMKGPDLAAASQWTEDQLTPAVKRMDKYAGAMSDADVALIVGLLRDPKVRDRLQAEQQRAAAQMAASLDAPNVAVGESLYWGREPLSAGGASCASCHTVRGYGGALGPDLTLLADKVTGVALVSAVQKANFPIMKAAYRDHPITAQEAVHLAAFFERVAQQGGAGTKSGSMGSELPGVLAVAAALTALFMAGVALVARKRAGGTRARLVRAAAVASPHHTPKSSR